MKKLYNKIKELIKLWRLKWTQLTSEELNHGTSNISSGLKRVDLPSKQKNKKKTSTKSVKSVSTVIGNKKKKGTKK